MPGPHPSVDVAVVGAGAAGLGAAKTLASRGLSFVVLEASHRIGGRAHTEAIAPGVAFDLGCHWLHSASINPFLAVADRLGLRYHKSGYGERDVYVDGRWATKAEQADIDDFFERSYAAVRSAAGSEREISVADVTERDHRWTGLFDYWESLGSSRDPDQVSVDDVMNYNDTSENWPLEDGYGTLIARFGADVPVELNCAVESIDWGGRELRLDTVRGTVTAARAIVTVSTGVLAAGDIRFAPALPAWKQEAIANLPLGVHNRICLVLEGNPFGPEHPSGIAYIPDDAPPMNMLIRPFGHDYVVAVTGGRYAAWLERAGVRATADLVREYLEKMFGAQIARRVVRHKVTAWGSDPWTKGSYSGAAPGRFRCRGELRQPIDECLYFAGEASSSEFYATAHGAYLTGIETADSVADSLVARPKVAER